MNKSSDKINNILDGLLKVIREEKAIKKVEVLDMEEIMEEIKAELAEELTNSKGKIITHIHKKYIHYIRGYLQSILRNLIGNAIKYRAPERPLVILITVRENGNFTELVVEDNGSGIDLSRYRKNMFQRFKRFNNHTPGTGIGLFMIKRMIEKYGGHISVESQPGKGTTFVVKLATINVTVDRYQTA